MKFYTTSRISENMHETPEGYLICIGVSIARTGEMDYGAGETPLEVGEDGRVIISREADEVFRPETMASFEGKALTIMHPKEFVVPENWSDLAKGSIQNVRRGKGSQENDLVADIIVTDKEAINLVKNGLREVSCGYEAEYLQTGVGRGVQKKIVGNHLALVDEGRAGSAYAINDHKGKGIKMKLVDQIKAIFAKAQDEALKVAKTIDEEKPKEEKEKMKDTDMPMVSLDDLMAACKDLGEKVNGFVQAKSGKDASTKPTMNEPAKIEAKDDEVNPGLEGRLKKLEEMVAKIMEAKASDAEPDEKDKEKAKDEEGDDLVTDEDEEADEEESEDDGYMVGDTAARVEILVPGMKLTGKDIKSQALKAAYATKDGKKVIDQFTAGKEPEYTDKSLIGAIFLGASEVLKMQRNAELAGTKAFKISDSILGEGSMSPEKINEINQKHYGPKT